MKSNSLNILITDDKSHRRTEMVEVFRRFGVVYRFNFSSEKVECDSQVPGRWKAVPDVPPIDLHLLHAGNKLQKDIVKAQWRVWYGGYGQDDTRVWQNEPVLTKKMNGETKLAEAEALSLIEYIQSEGKASPPAILKIQKKKNKLQAQRADFFDALSMPADFDWEAQLPEGLMLGVESDWETFKTESLQLLQQYPGFGPGHPEAYRKYSKLLARLHKSIVEDPF